MDSLKQFYTILVLFITTALFVVIAANNVYVNKTAQYVYIILFVILYIFIIVCAIKFHKLYFSNRFFVYGAICMVTILFIVLISVNTYMENFVGITLEPSIDGKTQIFSNDMDITYQDDIAEEQIFGNGITKKIKMNELAKMRKKNEKRRKEKKRKRKKKKQKKRLKKRLKNLRNIARVTMYLINIPLMNIVEINIIMIISMVFIKSVLHHLNALDTKKSSVSVDMKMERKCLMI